MNKLQVLQERLPDDQLIGKRTKPQALVIVGLLSTMYAIGSRCGWTVKEKVKREDYSEYELPHVTLKFFEGAQAQAQFGRGKAQVLDPAEYAKGLYHVWKFYEDLETYNQQLAELIAMLAETKLHLKHLHPMVYVYTVDSLTCGLMFQGTASCGDQFRAELSFW